MSCPFFRLFGNFFFFELSVGLKLQVSWIGTLKKVVSRSAYKGVIVIISKICKPEEMALALCLKAFELTLARRMAGREEEGKGDTGSEN